ncbi:MAG: hypothetical protein KC506_01740 [Nanoarchaeota archaeon]|nr:hypothetical protein [Nanoarchaeota archaeon]
MKHKPRIVKDIEFQNDPVLKDLEDFKHEPSNLNDSKLHKMKAKTKRAILIAALIIMALLYILARLRL